MRRAMTVTVGLGLVLLAACGGDGGFTQGDAPSLEVNDGTNPVSQNGTVTVAANVPTRISVSNTGTGALEIKQIVLSSSVDGAFTLSSLPMPTADEPIYVYPDDYAHEFTLIYTPVAGSIRPTATVTLVTNKTIEGTETFKFEVSPEVATPRLLVQPQVVDFDTVSEGASSTKAVALLNTGAVDLVISGFYLSGSPGYTVDFAGQSYVVTAETASTGITLATPVTIASGASQHLDITYTASGPEPAEGELTLLSNDPNSPTVIQMYANVAGPCIQVSPTRVDFGGKLVGQQSTINLQIQSCGDRALTISNVQWVDDGFGMFAMTDIALGTLPVDLEPGQTLYLPIIYTPVAVSPVGSSGSPELDEGMLRITSNAYIANYDVEVSGFGTDGSCPNANITVTEGEEVIPQTTLHLSAAGSAATNGAITGWEWSVVQPSGSASVFLPSPYVEKPTFEANVVGEYIFRLKVYDALGTVSCEEATYTVYVTSPEAIHVELLWTTPGDVDETDTGYTAFGESVGSDVDLHFLHPNAINAFNPTGWFDSRYDCYWSDTAPNWGGAGATDDPSLDRDDTDGAGPENLNLAFPENGTSYKVGVHYWDDWGYGISFATIRVYIYGQLRMQWANVQLVNFDMWDVATIAWPSGSVTKLEGGGSGSNQPVITHDYPVPFF
ncbi:MAG: choice-of-anchor D domain-containing protein [Deltaproteobacteria bacterium]|nr:MAG: choice-of-anchor D domain-containing protein [Deltaproteobacteria bacterium]